MPVLASPVRRTTTPLAESCPVCGGRASLPFHAADAQPALLHALATTPTAARSAPRADLRFEGCRQCGLVRNRAFRPELVPYGAGYLNTQRASAVYLDHENAVASAVAALGAEHEGIILEIGSGDGTVARRLRDLTGRPCIGFDPAGPERAGAGDGVRLFARRFDAEARSALEDAAGSEPIAVACARHVLEHVPDPLELLRDAHAVLADGAHLVIEVPDVDWICRHGAFYDFFHEHCCLFDATGIRAAIEHAGFRVERMRRTFGGQYLLAEATRRPTGIPLPARPGPERITRVAARVAAGRAATDAWMRRASRGTAIWGAGAKGVSLVNQLDPDARLGIVVVDEHPGKQGRFVPGTGHEIVAPEHLAAHPPTAVLAMNRNYAREIRRRLDALDVRAPLHLVTGLAADALRR